MHFVESDGSELASLWQWTLMPGDTHESDAHSPGTKEILHVIRGTVTLGMSVDSIDLSAGETFAFAGDQPHSYANTGTETATFILTVSESDVGIMSEGNQHG